MLNSTFLSGLTSVISFLVPIPKKRNLLNFLLQHSRDDQIDGGGEHPAARDAQQQATVSAAGVQSSEQSSLPLPSVGASVTTSNGLSTTPIGSPIRSALTKREVKDTQLAILPCCWLDNDNLILINGACHCCQLP